MPLFMGNLCRGTLVLLLLAVPCRGAETRSPGEWTEARALVDARVNRFIESGRFADALRAADSLIAAGEDDSRALTQRAHSLAGLTRAKEAIAAYEKSLLKDYENCETHLQFATYLMRIGKTGRAETEFMEAKVFCDEWRYPLIYRNLAVAAVKLGKPQVARQYADEGLRTSPRDPYLSGIKGMLIASENPLEAETLFVRSQAGGETTSDFLVQYGLFLINRGRPAEAVGVLERASAFEPDDRETRGYLAEALDRANRFAEAEKILKDLLAVQDEPETRKKLARVLFHERKYEKALELYKSLDSSPEVMDRMAMCYQKLGNSDEALRWARKAVAAKPDWPQGMINLAVILGSRAELEEAAGLLKRVLVLEPDNVAVRADLERIKKALEDVKRSRQKKLLKSP
jgi:tetratricopeptide (TPR) repeat protein